MRAGAVKQEQQGLTLLLSSQKANVMDKKSICKDTLIVIVLALKNLNQP